jgi:hypothetical protein
MVLLWQLFFFTGKFAPNFDLKNMISNYTQDENLMRKIAQICQILILKIFKLSDVYDNFEVGSQEYSSKYSFFFPTFISSMQPKQANLAKLFYGWLSL